MFINTKKEAQIAAQIAEDYGFEVLKPTMFYKRYVTNVFSPWASENDARAAQREIVASIRTERALRARSREELVRATSIPAHHLVGKSHEEILDSIE